MYPVFLQGNVETLENVCSSVYKILYKNRMTTKICLHSVQDLVVI